MKYISQKSEKAAKKILDKYYASLELVPEKKNYLIDLNKSFGPYLATQSQEYILDASSQIASIGAGFNSSPLLGAAQFQESWLNRKDSSLFKELRKSYENFLKRQLGWENVSSHFCHSGAEANETALFHCYERRQYKSRKKVLAFKGSFHGRTLVSLSATWNPPKREPFEIPGFEAIYSDYPEMDNSQPEKILPDLNWLKLWERPFKKNFKKAFAELLKSSDFLMREEAKILHQIHELLSRQIIFAVLIEPMQCEGGDRYSSARFHNGLLALCQAHGVPLIYDEVQTGFGLGGVFFWHKLFMLRNSRGAEIYPDYVVCAKKAQAGIALSHQRINLPEEYSSVSLIRGFFQAVAMEQSYDDISNLQGLCREKLEKLAKKFSEYIKRPRVKGLCFAFDLPDQDVLNRFVNLRFEEGIMFYPAGQLTARFRLSFGFRSREVSQLFQKIEQLLQRLSGESVKALPMPDYPKQDYHESKIFLMWWLQQKLELSTAKKKKKIKDEMLLKNFCQMFPKFLPAKAKISLVASHDFSKYKKRLKNLQETVYEPSRRTSVKTFERVYQNEFGIFLAVEVGSKLVGMACAGSLRFFPEERGTQNDPQKGSRKTIYMLDVTIHPDFRGVGLGKFLKYCVLGLAFNRGAEFIKGRNRSRLAKRMWWLNQGLGAYLQKFLEGDYPDSILPNDCLYYNIPLKFADLNPNLKEAHECHLTSRDLNGKYLHKNAPSLVNKLCLSNFVSQDYLKSLTYIRKILPENLTGLYSASGVSEAADKIFKALWLKKKNSARVIGFKGGYFGAGSFLSRGLSGIGQNYFPVSLLPNPDGKGQENALQELSDELERGDCLGVFVEPLAQRSLTRLKESSLIEVKSLCKHFNTPLIYHETASLFNRYSDKYFIPSLNKKLEPDIGFFHLGGQMSLIYMKEKYWNKTPLMFISTWDGDEYSLNSFCHALKKHLENKNWKKELKKFESSVSNFLKPYMSKPLVLKNGVGSFEAGLPLEYRHMFMEAGSGKYGIYASPSNQRHFTDWLDQRG